MNQQQIDAIKKANIKAKIHQSNLRHLIVNKFIENNIDISYIDKISLYLKNNTYVTTMLLL